MRPRDGLTLRKRHRLAAPGVSRRNKVIGPVAPTGMMCGPQLCLHLRRRHQHRHGGLHLGSILLAAPAGSSRRHMRRRLRPPRQRRAQPRADFWGRQIPRDALTPVGEVAEVGTDASVVCDPPPLRSNPIATFGNGLQNYDRGPLPTPQQRRYPARHTTGRTSARRGQVVAKPDIDRPAGLSDITGLPASRILQPVDEGGHPAASLK